MTEPNTPEINLHEKKANDLYSARKFQQASSAYSLAADFYLSQREEVRAAEMRNNQCVALLQAKKPRDALTAVNGTALIFETGGDYLKQAMAYANEATALKDLGKKSEAIEKFILAADLFNQLNEVDMHLEVMQSISALKLKSRNLVGALFSMQDGLEQLEKPTLRQRLLLKLLKFPQNLMEK
ncbi:MAG: hypothetical protein MUO54_10155 [Anaerolineales bacterium]|nr:hypothetical protein [Anaerolineales bacterium]